jgi:formamidopyrimidine-DNA glycosylase
VPELPEVEVLARHLRPLLEGRTIKGVKVLRERVLGGTSVRRLQRTLSGGTFTKLERRGKFLLFTLSTRKKPAAIRLVGHLGMTGRMYLLSSKASLPKHAAVVLDLGSEKFVFEDTRYFGRFTLDPSGIEKLGPEPLSAEFTDQYLAVALSNSRQAIKVKLLDQKVVAGLGNIYASEALFRSGILPTVPAGQLNRVQLERLGAAIRAVVKGAIEFGISAALDYAGAAGRDGLFYFGSDESGSAPKGERFSVYDRADQPCTVCGEPIRRLVQAARSTYYCARCQAG